ncbi:MAG: ubiquitin-related domain-containing protein [Benniella sp.]|nr:MAG: ubiquitin-related domain-containing protein [Benniella sp.]
MATKTLDILLANQPGKSIAIPYNDDELISTLIQRISRHLDEDDADIHERDLYINAIRIKDHDKIISQYRVFGNCFTYHPLRKSNLITVYVTTLMDRSIHVQCDPSHTIYRIKEMLELKEGYPPFIQRLVFGGKLLNDETRSLASLDITHESKIHIVLAIGGGNAGAAETLTLSDVTVMRKYQFTEAAPEGRLCMRGTNIECQCPCTPDYLVVSPRLYGLVNLIDSQFECPNCRSMNTASPITAGFVECRYRFHGIKSTGEQYSSEWKEVTAEDCYQLFDTSCKATWVQLFIESTNLFTSEVCALCLGHMDESEQRDCGHRFHGTCSGHWDPCPRCRFNQHLITL